jgi:GTP-binding protein Era
MVREQVFLLTREEVPYAAAVTIDTYEERAAPASVAIAATIHVEKEAQKKIVVGEGGRMVREIGSRARREIGQMLDCPVHLTLFVRVDDEWSHDARAIRDLGYE